MALEHRSRARQRVDSDPAGSRNTVEMGVAARASAWTATLAVASMTAM